MICFQISTTTKKLSKLYLMAAMQTVFGESFLERNTMQVNLFCHVHILEKLGLCDKK